jgi:hypothetical protein
MKTPELPPEIKVVLDPLKDAVIHLHANHSMFKELYGTRESTDVLNKVAPGAFFLIGLMFRENFIVAASRLTDPKTTGFGKNAKENLTLKQLIHVFRQHCSDEKFVDELDEREKKITDQCESIRDVRNRAVAHFDLKTALNTHSDPLPNVEMKQIDDFLQMLAEFMDTAIGHYDAAQRDFNPLITGPARNIVECLKQYFQLREFEKLKREL